MSRMSRADRREWEQARTLTELGELTARWLEGDIASQPGYRPNCGPARETTELIPTLAKLNRAGYVTRLGSQPGLPPTEGYDGRLWSQRAAVSGFADDATTARILTAVDGTGLRLIGHDTPLRRRLWPRWRRPGNTAVDVTTAGGRVTNDSGARMSLGDLESCFAELGQEGFAAVRDAIQVTVIDPVWGRDEYLWSVLSAVVDPSEVAA